MKLTSPRLPKENKRVARDISLVVLLFCCRVANIAAADLAPELQKAVLAEDWQTVAGQAAQETADESSPVRRFLQAHACLALNRNNESACLFLGLSSNDLPILESWMASFATRNPSRLVARYLHADALARSGRHQEALALWDSLATTNHHALSLNARGVLYATLGQLDKAGEDFAAAVAAAPDFADALANRGLRLLQKKSGARGALAWFEKAMEKSADFALARFGHGCAHFALGNYDKAFADLRIVKTNDCIFSNLMVVVSAMSDYMTVRPDPKLADASTDEVGTILDRHLADLVVSPDQGNYNRVIGDWQAQPREVQSRMLGRIQDLARGNPGFASRLDQLNRNSLDWNRTGGWGEMFASLSGASVSAFGFGGSPGSTFAQRQMDITRRNYDLSERISRTLGSSRITPVNGVTTRAANVHAEELEAYFFPGYGLHLPAPGRNDLPHLNPK